MEDKDFEILWLQNRERLLAEDTEWQAMKESYKVHGVTDVLFYAIPIIVGIMCLDYLPIANELLRWVVCAGIIIVVMAICMLSLKTRFGFGKKKIRDFYDDVKGTIEIMDKDAIFNKSFSTIDCIRMVKDLYGIDLDEDFNKEE